MTFLQTKNGIWFFGRFCHFHTFASIEVNFHYFRKQTKMPFPTFQDLSIDILHVKIRLFLRILKKCILLLKKVRFPFFTLAVGKIWFIIFLCNFMVNDSKLHEMCFNSDFVLSSINIPNSKGSNLCTLYIEKVQ